MVMAQVAMATCDRSPQYVHQTLESMFAGSNPLNGTRDIANTDVRLVVCGDDGSYLDRWDKGHSNVTVETLTDEQWIEVLERNAKHRTMINFMRILDGADPNAAIIALQDDLAFAPRWYERTLEVAEHAAKKHGPSFILSLYAAYRFKQRPSSLYNGLRFYGNQALYLPPAMHQALRHFFRERIDAGKYLPDDMMVKAPASTKLQRLRAADPNRVRHHGETSAIEQRFHESPSFKIAVQMG